MCLGAVKYNVEKNQPHSHRQSGVCLCVSLYFWIVSSWSSVTATGGHRVIIFCPHVQWKFTHVLLSLSNVLLKKKKCQYWHDALTSYVYFFSFYLICPTELKMYAHPSLPPLFFCEEAQCWPIYIFFVFLVVFFFGRGTTQHQKHISSPEDGGGRCWSTE